MHDPYRLSQLTKPKVFKYKSTNGWYTSWHAECVMCMYRRHRSTWDQAFEAAYQHSNMSTLHHQMIKLRKQLGY